MAQGQLPRSAPIPQADLKSILNDLLRGTAIAVPAAFLCWLLARFAFSRIYYLPLLLALVMVLMILTAWAIHLREDGFFRGPKKEARAEPRRMEPERPFPSFDDDVIERAPVDGKSAPMLTAREVMRALLWAAAETCLLSVLVTRWMETGLPLMR